MAGDCLIAGSGVFLYCRIAIWNQSRLTLPSLPAFPEMILLTVFTPTSALQFPCGYATDVSRWCPVLQERGGCGRGELRPAIRC